MGCDAPRGGSSFQKTDGRSNLVKSQDVQLHHGNGGIPKIPTDKRGMGGGGGGGEESKYDDFVISVILSLWKQKSQ